jgi:hypothetical protein
MRANHGDIQTPVERVRFRRGVNACENRIVTRLIFSAAFGRQMFA